MLSDSESLNDDFILFETLNFYKTTFFLESQIHIWNEIQ